MSRSRRKHLNQKSGRGMVTEPCQPVVHNKLFVPLSIFFSGVVFLIAGMLVGSIPGKGWIATDGKLLDTKIEKAPIKNGSYFISLKYSYKSPEGSRINHFKWCTFDRFYFKSSAKKALKKLESTGHIKVFYNPENATESTCSMKNRPAYGFLSDVFIWIFYVLSSVVLVVFVIPMVRKRKKTENKS
ncbi:hypothetical protein KKF34_10195 [Myxococcota bacterium]|nr:hypothetical protein [Myxococcota bacterium]MBU1380415.1 hypothetical protein [Myxococcota bacterium]MBU1497235.1 hypothetical protein [Myxococcota bacterium]